MHTFLHNCLPLSLTHSDQELSHTCKHNLCTLYICTIQFSVTDPALSVDTIYGDSDFTRDSGCVSGPPISYEQCTTPTMALGDNWNPHLCSHQINMWSEVQLKTTHHKLPRYYQGCPLNTTLCLYTPFLFRMIAIVCM